MEAVGPCVFGVEGPFDLVEGEVGTKPPALALEQTAKGFGVADMALAFGGAYVEPDAWAGMAGGVEVADKGEDAALIPPDGGGEYAEATEGLGALEAEIEADESAERGAAEPGVLGTDGGSVGSVDEGDELVDDEAAVTIAVAATHLEVGGGGVLGHAAEAGIRDADEDEGLGLVGFVEPVGGGAGAPGVARYIGGAGIEEVLTVVEIEDGEAAGGVCRVLRRQIDGDAAVVGEDGGVEVIGFEALEGVFVGVGEDALEGWACVRLFGGEGGGEGFEGGRCGDLQVRGPAPREVELSTRITKD